MNIFDIDVRVRAQRLTGKLVLQVCDEGFWRDMKVEDLQEVRVSGYRRPSQRVQLPARVTRPAAEPQRPAAPTQNRVLAATRRVDGA